MSRSPSISDRGFMLVEVLISLALLAMIMVAAAVAIDAAFQSHAYNTEKTRNITLARAALDRMERDFRRAASVDLDSPYSITVVLPDDTEKTYSWSGTAGDPMMLTQDGSTGVLVPAVESLQFDIEQEYDEELEDYKTTLVSISLELRSEKHRLVMRASTRPRRNIY
ncbi:MAG: prepilin-type N-terminal cleavage/methylation domain-containing protein [Planctomycetia bacterium]|nr:prepilin-type N-terminal cleavage/methylation domain-containing protein [Planctomycetia bacterium]